MSMVYTKIFQRCKGDPVNYKHFCEASKSHVTFMHYLAYMEIEIKIEVTQIESRNDRFTTVIY